MDSQVRDWNVSEKNTQNPLSKQSEIAQQQLTVMATSFNKQITI